nr:hypothetical protein GCM10020063_094120 [Dactylosporangium thailandense]
MWTLGIMLAVALPTVAAAAFTPIRVAGSTAVVALLGIAAHALLRQARDRHRAQAALLHTVLRRFPSPVLVTDPDGNVVLANPAAQDLIGGEPALETFDGRPVRLADLTREGRDAYEARLTRADGSTSDILIEALPVEGGAGTVWALQDISARRVYEESLHHAAYHDALTGLPNRALLWQHLTSAAADGRPYAVLVVDVDDFRTVNELHGRAVGDEVLTAVAHRLRDAAYAGTRTAPARAVVARLGGDEFAVLLPGADARAAKRLAPELRAAFDRPFPTSAGRVTVRAAIDVSTTMLADA